MRETLISNDSNFSSSVQIQNNKQINSVSVNNILKSSDLCVSIETCPNRYLNFQLLSEIPHSFCSVTWFSPTDEELKNADRIPAILLAKQLRFEGYHVLLHITGRNLKRCQALSVLKILKEADIRNVFALQGDPSQIKEWDDEKCDFPYAADLVKFIRSCYGNFFTIGVAAYPEKHPKSPSLEFDLINLKYKVSCGADFIITQAAFDTSTFSNFVKQCRTMQIHIPIIPGIFIINSFRTLMLMSNFCGVIIPQHILEIVQNNKDNDVAVRKFGIYHASEMMKIFLKNKYLFGGIHVFSLNNLELLRDVLIRIGLYFTIERPLKLNRNVDVNDKI